MAVVDGVGGGDDNVQQGVRLLAADAYAVVSDLLGWSAVWSGDQLCAVVSDGQRCGPVTNCVLLSL